LKIPFVQLYSEVKEQIFVEVQGELKELVKSSQFVMGEAVAHFEKEYAELAGCKYGIGINSGTDGLFLALKAFGVEAGDEVITAPNSFLASAGAIAVIGAKPVFCDIGDDYNLDPNKLEAAITPKTKAIMPVHLCGNPADMDPIMEIARKHKLRVVEDAAQSVRAEYKGRRTGSLGDVGAFSLHPLKNLHLWGDGGMMTTNSKDLAEYLRKARNHGLKDRNESEFFSFNSRLDTIQAIVGRKSIKHLEDTTNKRRKNAAYYNERLASVSDYVKRPVLDKDRYHVFHVYVIRAEKRDELQKHLASKGIDTKIHYPIPIHLMKAAEYLGHKKGDFPVTEKLSQEILSIPVRENLSESEINEVCDGIESFYR